MGKKELLLLVFILSIPFSFAVLDQYEPDDAIGSATTILTNGTRQTHTFSPAGDEDFYYFEAYAGTKYTVLTDNLENSADTVIYLYDDDGITELSSNDDILAGLILNSKITWEVTKDSVLFVKAEDYSSSRDNGTYDISVTESPIVNSVNCGNQSDWIECSDVSYGFNLTRIRANCTYKDASAIDTVGFILENIEDSSLLLNVNNATYFDGTFFIYNTAAILINDSGKFNLSALCITNESASETSQTTWNIPWGTLFANITFPTESIIVRKDSLFNITSEVSCSGGECQGLIAYLDPKEKSKEMPGKTRKLIAEFKDSEIKPKSFAKAKKQVISKKKPDADINSLRIRLPKARELKKIGNTDKISIEIEEEDLPMLLQDESLTNIREDRVFHIQLSESIPLVHANEAWNIGANGSGETICLIDTGVSYTHEDFGACLGSDCVVIAGYDFVNEDSDPIDDQGHGTHVAGIIASQDPVYRGVAPGAKIVALKACDSDGTCYESDIISSVDWCIDNKETYNISIVSMSLGGDVLYEEYCDEDYMAPFINQISEAGLMAFVASGNDGSSTGISSPACLRQAIAVGSTTKFDAVSSFTDRNLLLDILAPGSSIVSLLHTGGTTTKSGTSMATPHASAVGAILLSYYKNQMNRTLSTIEAEHLLKAFGVEIHDSGSGLNFPRLDALASLANKGIVPMQHASSPFYTTGQNPVNSTSDACLFSLKSGQSCINSWFVNATAESTATYEFFTFYDSLSNQYVKSNIVNVTVDNDAPTIVININGTNSTTPINSSAVLFSVNISDNHLIDSVYYSIDSPALISVMSSVDAAEYFAYAEANITPGKHMLRVFSNDTFSNIANTTVVFYSEGTFNLSQKIADNLESSEEILDIIITRSDNTTIPDLDNETISQQEYDLEYILQDMNLSILNVSGISVSWQQNMSFSTNLSDFAEFSNISGHNLTYGIFVDTDDFVSGSSYYGKVSLPAGANNYSYIHYKYNLSSDPQTVALCPGDAFTFSDLPCYLTSTVTEVYVEHFSYVLAYVDTTAPNITISNPENSSVINYSTGINITLSTDEEAYCNFTFNGSVHGFAQENATFFYDLLDIFNPFTNGQYNSTILCRDLFNNERTETVVFSVNDTIAPVIALTSPTGHYSTTAANVYPVPILISTDEFANLSYRVDSGTATGIYSISERQLSSSAELNLATGTYSVNVTAVDVNGNIASGVSGFTVYAKKEVISSNSGGGGGGSPVFTDDEETEAINENMTEGENETEQGESVVPFRDANDIIISVSDDKINVEIFNAVLDHAVFSIPVHVRYPSGIEETYYTDEKGSVLFAPREEGFIQFIINNRTFYQKFEPQIQGNAVVEIPYEQDNENFGRLYIVLVVCLIAGLLTYSVIFCMNDKPVRELLQSAKEMKKHHSEKMILEKIRKKGWDHEVIEKVKKKVFR
ncbi:MAG: S8 family serine peptidase [Nanoarchaeota archaeon]|nr:S8 family serine peptidase [Nanoarchaeota archaeon]